LAEGKTQLKALHTVLSVLMTEKGRAQEGGGKEIIGHQKSGNTADAGKKKKRARVLQGDSMNSRRKKKGKILGRRRSLSKRLDEGLGA